MLSSHSLSQFSVLGDADLLPNERSINEFAGAECDCCLKYVPIIKRDAIMITNRRILVRETMSLFCILMYLRRQSFRIKDLHHMSLFVDRRVRYGVYGSISTLIGVLFKVLLEDDNRAAALIIAIPSIIGGILSILVFIRALFSRDTLTLDFYKKETVHSWLFGVFNFLKRRKGSSCSVKLVLSRPQCLAVMDILYQHELSPFLDGQERGDA